MLFELLIEFKPIVLQFLDILIRLFGISFATLGVVYIAGRMLEIVNSDRSKNLLALILIYVLQFLYEFFHLNLNKEEKSYNLLINLLVDKGWDIFLYGCISIVIYVTVCWKLYSRIDNFLNKKIGEGGERSSVNKKLKKKK